MKKGIEPVVATILLLLIVIAIIGFAYTFFSGIVGSAAGSTESQLKATISQMSKGIWIDSASGASATVRNLGTQSIVAGEISSVKVNGAAASCTSWNPLLPLVAGRTSICTLSVACTSGQLVEISGPSNTATRICS